ncbi:MAG TPA: hypothetical protein PLJ23_02525, partial [Gemmatimonadales bacterium]|nr:hypothetical protein [Gemmatimonadales bacterium]
MHPNDSEQPEIGLPAEAIFEALLEEQTPVPFERPVAAPSATPPAPAPAAAAPDVPVPAHAALLKGPAAALARNMDASLSIPTATTFR